MTRLQAQPQSARGKPHRTPAPLARAATARGSRCCSRRGNFRWHAASPGEAERPGGLAGEIGAVVLVEIPVDRSGQRGARQRSGKRTGRLARGRRYRSGDRLPACRQRSQLDRSGLRAEVPALHDPAGSAAVAHSVNVLCIRFRRICRQSRRQGARRREALRGAAVFTGASSPSAPSEATQVDRRCAESRKRTPAFE